LLVAVIGQSCFLEWELPSRGRSGIIRSYTSYCLQLDGRSEQCYVSVETCLSVDSLYRVRVTRPCSIR